MDGVCVCRGGWRGFNYQHADAKMQVRGWMNAVYGNAARLCSVARQKKRDAQEAKNCRVAKNAEVLLVQYGTAGARGAEYATDNPPDYCTSMRRLRSRMYFPSLYFWDCSYALSYFQPSIVLHLQQ